MYYNFLAQLLIGHGVMSGVYEAVDVGILGFLFYYDRPGNIAFLISVRNSDFRGPVVHN